MLMKRALFKEIENILSSGEGLSFEKALEVSRLKEMDLLTLFDLTNRIRDKFKGDEVNLCAIINAKSGFCSEDCSFCSQSVHHKTKIDTYPLVEPSRILEAALQAARSGARFLS